MIFKIVLVFLVLKNVSSLTPYTFFYIVKIRITPYVYILMTNEMCKMRIFYESHYNKAVRTVIYISFGCTFVFFYSSKYINRSFTG